MQNQEENGRGVIILSKEKAVSNEEIVSALIQHSTIKDASDSVGLSTRALYDRMKANDFRIAYTNAKAVILRKAVFDVAGKVSSALDEIMRIMLDTSVSASIRLQAAQMLIDNADKLSYNLTRIEDSAIQIGGAFDLNQF